MELTELDRHLQVILAQRELVVDFCDRFSLHLHLRATATDGQAGLADCVVRRVGLRWCFAVADRPNPSSQRRYAQLHEVLNQLPDEHDEEELELQASERPRPEGDEEQRSIRVHELEHKELQRERLVERRVLQYPYAYIHVQMQIVRAQPGCQSTATLDGYLGSII